MTDERHVPFGPAPRPTSDADLEARVRELVAAYAPPGAQGLDQVDVTASLDGADIAALAVDLSGVSVGVDGAEPVRLPSVEVTHRERAVLRRLQVVAHPASVAGVPVQVDVAASDVPFAWATSSTDQLFLELQPPSESDPVVGTARISAPRREIVAAARTVLGAELAKRGFTLTDLDLQLENLGPRALSVRAQAKVKRSVVRAAVEVTAQAQIDDALVLSIRDADISSSNPIVSALVAPFRPRIAAMAARRIDLAALLPAGVSVTDVSLVAGADDIVASVAVG